MSPDEQDNRIKKELFQRLQENEKRKREKEIQQLDLEACQKSHLCQSFKDYEAKLQGINSKFWKY